MSVGESLKRHWSSHDLKINAGASEAELRAFEDKYGVVLPEDLREYLSCVNGMAHDVVDDGLIRFWTLEEVIPVSEGAPQYSDRDYVQDPETLFLFADYSIWAHAYAIRLGKAVLNSNEVVVIGYQSPKLIAESFSGFVEIYLTAKDLLH